MHGGVTPVTWLSTVTGPIRFHNNTNAACGTNTISRTRYVKCTAVPTCTDGIQNGLETGIDCGGPTCPACVSGHNIGTGNLTACSGNLFDTGGNTTNYSNSENITETYCSNSGNCIQVNFTSFNTESGYDKLYIYDGPTTGSPLIGVYDGTALPNGGIITSSSGCLTFNFISDGSVVRPGWSATISCVACPIPTCTDGIQNGLETGIDCGGPTCPACPAIIIPTACTNTTYTLPASTSVVFYDDGGPGGDPCSSGVVGNYANTNCFTTVTVCGAPGQFIIANFRVFAMFNTNSGFDWMVIYDNNTTSGPILFDNRAIGSTNGNPPLFTTSSTTTGADNPLGDCNFTLGLMDYCSTGNCLTFQFWATSVVNRAGWDCLINSVAASCVLPIELVEFIGHNEGQVNKLTWKTATEINNDYFRIDRSRDGQNWKRIGIVMGSGTSSTTHSYFFNDGTYIPGVNYYKLTQNDFDGKSESFPIISINNEIKKYKKWDYIVNLLGQTVNDNYTGFRILIWKDGTTLKLNSTQKNPLIRK